MLQSTRRLAVSFAFAVAASGPAHGALPDCDGVSPAGNTTLKGVTVVTGLGNEPLLVTAAPGDVDRIFVVEQAGFIRSHLRGAAPGAHTLFLDISSRVETSGNEQGLLGLAFGPDFDTQGYFYVYYTEVTSWDTVVSRFSLDSTDPTIGDPTSETILMRFSQPQMNHNAGHIAFGDDGYLYVATGDGGGSNDAHGTCGNGQNTGNLLGKILRIDPSGTATESPDCTTTAGPYTIPSDNPLNDGAGGDCDEIWAWGLRNPWRWSFDAVNGDMYIADVGQGCWEEINYVDQANLGGQNYGWRQMEGNHCFNPSVAGCTPPGQTCGGSPNCNDPSLTTPVLEYDSTMVACSVTGGYVYRGCRMPQFDGIYFYGDYCDGTVRSFKIVGGLAMQRSNWTSQVDPGGTLLFGLTSFGTDAQGEIYVVDRNPGSVIKFLPPFTELEVSGVGAADSFLLHRNGNWTWEDLAYSTMHPVDYYSVYRGTPNSSFTCIHSTTSTDWVAGDATVPGPGQLLAYLVTAQFKPTAMTVEDSSAGSPPRTLINPCAQP